MPSRSHRGASLLEFVVVMALIFLFTAMAVRMLSRFSIESEQLRMQQVLNELRQSLLVLTSEQSVRYNLAALADWDGANPVALLRTPPENYLGEFVTGDSIEAEGNWYYHRDRGTLIYQASNPDYLLLPGQQEDVEKRVEFRLNFKYEDKDANGRFDADSDRAYGLALEPVRPYEWLVLD